MHRGCEHVFGGFYKISSGTDLQLLCCQVSKSKMGRVSDDASSTDMWSHFEKWGSILMHSLIIDIF